MNTPTKTRGVGAGKAADLTYWEGAARMIASVSTSSKIVVEKSTVPVKTAEAIEKASTAPASQPTSPDGCSSASPCVVLVSPPQALCGAVRGVLLALSGRAAAGPSVRVHPVPGMDREA